MALVILPCDLPWWSNLQYYLQQLESTKNGQDLVNGMLTIHTMCNVGLDPDEAEGPDLTIFDKFKQFIEEDMSEEDRTVFFNRTLPNITKSALNLKSLKPIDGLQFSLQQQVFQTDLDRQFVRSLIAHAFFSTFPKRSNMSHPTLQDFNFTNFFVHLNHNLGDKLFCRKFQKGKLWALLWYFDLLAANEDNLSSAKPLTIIRQVMTGIEWLTVEDWQECNMPLCPLTVKHECRMENADTRNLFICFSNKKIGGKTLSDGSSKECIQFTTYPELLVTLLFVESLEDNEVITIKGALQVGKINNPRQKGVFEPNPNINTAVNICCMDAECYSRFPFSQYEEDNILRELNKALLGFRQKQQQLIHHTYRKPISRRLSPIGESFSPISDDEPFNKIKHKECHKPFSSHLAKGKFIVLGSSGELLPISRHQQTSEYSSCESSNSSPEEYHTAYTSIPDLDNLDKLTEEEDFNARRYSGQLDTAENRNLFANRLKQALCGAESNATDSSYAVDISVSGSSIGDPNIRMKRGGSRGFILEEESIEELEECERPVGDSGFDDDYKKFTIDTAAARRNKGGSSRYSFSTDCNSDLESVYDQLNQWVEELEGKTQNGSYQQQRLRDNAVIQFAGGLMKRTLSESFVGVPLSEGEDSNGDIVHSLCKGRFINDRRFKMAARSLSLELAKHKHKLASQLMSVIGQKQNYPGSVLPVVTGNWGCGSRNLGDPQMKLLIQWIAASVAGVPNVIYYTCSNQKLLKLDTICRVLLDRDYHVGELVQGIIDYTKIILSNSSAPTASEGETLFDFLMNKQIAAITRRDQ